MISIDQIEAAAERARPHVRRTPLVPIEGRALLKLESLQPAGSFKVRGFFAAALALPRDKLARGLLTVSAGNAAMAASYVAHALGVACRVVMPDTAPTPKVNGVRRWGGVPVQMPREQMMAWMAGRGWESEPETFIHPFADEAVMAGHGGLGLEILEQAPATGRVVVAVGGGGLIVGVASALKARRPDIEVVGVQSDGYPLWPRTFAEGAPPQVTPSTIADGTTAPFDPKMHDYLRTTVDRWVTVPESRLRAAVRELALGAKLVAEGAGALAYAALEQLPPGPETVAVVSGGNIAPALLRDLLAEE